MLPHLSLVVVRTGHSGKFRSYSPLVRLPQGDGMLGAIILLGNLFSAKATFFESVFLQHFEMQQI